MKMASSFSIDKVAPKHNFRVGQIPNNVDRERIKDNVVIIDNLHGRTIEQYTNDELQPFIDMHNAKQKRKDRRIDTTYTEWHLKDKNMMKGVLKPEDIKWAWEAVLCYGNHEDYWKEYFDPRTTEDRRKEMYDEAVNFYTQATYAFKLKYPHLEIIYSVIHADENLGSLHCHLCFQGRGREYERSLVERVSISRALEQDGFEHIHNATMAKDAGGFQMERMFKDFRHNVMNQQLIEMGYEIKEEEHGKQHISANAYTELMKKATAEMEKAKSMINFIEPIAKSIEEEKEKIITTKDPEIKKKQVKDGLFSQPYTVVEMPEDLYESRRAQENIKRLSELAEDAAKQVKRASEKTLSSIENETNQALEERAERLQQELYEERQKNIELTRAVKKYETIIENVKSFLREFNLVQKWTRFLDKIRERDQEVQRSRS